MVTSEETIERLFRRGHIWKNYLGSGTFLYGLSISILCAYVAAGQRKVSVPSTVR